MRKVENIFRNEKLIFVLQKDEIGSVADLFETTLDENYIQGGLIQKKKRPTKSKNKWRKGKKRTNKRGIVDNRRKKAWELEYANVCSLLAGLSNPFENMSLMEKKSHAIWMFFENMKVSSVFLR